MKERRRFLKNHNRANHVAYENPESDLVALIHREKNVRTTESYYRQADTNGCLQKVC